MQVDGEPLVHVACFSDIHGPPSLTIVIQHVRLSMLSSQPTLRLSEASPDFGICPTLHMLHVNVFVIASQLWMMQKPIFHCWSIMTDAETQDSAKFVCLQANHG